MTQNKSIENNTNPLKLNWGSTYALNETQVIVANKITELLAGLTHREGQELLLELSNKIGNVAIIKNPYDAPKTLTEQARGV
ncbi:MAG TPA: hypothetical protein VNW95_09245 [Mucilaginibacter sp.]|nr:hypothetical protein [Mucilaginibacter sp.]